MSGNTEPAGHEPVYQWHEDVENLENYVQGGYHPVHIFELYHNNQFLIVHKLGYGSYSTVWLAMDTTSWRLAALKILRADASESSAESETMTRLRDGPKDHPGRSFVAKFLSEFFIEGPNGRHRCIVTEPVGYSVAQAKECSTTWKFPPKIAMDLALGVLSGLTYIHACGIVHGDLHVNNILIKSQCFELRSIADLFERIGKPETHPVKRVDGKALGPEVPRYCVPPATIVCPADEVDSADVVIADFGESFFCKPEETRTDVSLRTPILLLPPEAIFKEPLDPAVDIWTAGCTLFEIFGERPLFEGFLADEDHTVAEMISTLGPLPVKWWDVWPAKKEYFLEDGSWKTDTEKCHAPYSRSLAERLRGMGRGMGEEGGEFTTDELFRLEGRLRRMLEYEPSKRPTAEEIRRWLDSNVY